jgi:hypothetical protein
MPTITQIVAHMPGFRVEARILSGDAVQLCRFEATTRLLGVWSLHRESDARGDIEPRRPVGETPANHVHCRDRTSVPPKANKR